MDRGDLRAESRRALPIRPAVGVSAKDPSAEALVERLRDAIFEDAGEPDERTSVLVAMIHCTHNLGRVYGKNEVRERQAARRRVANVS